MLTIVIPCKNEELYIRKILDSLVYQFYLSDDTKIIIADANSTDSTISIISSYKSKLNIEIVQGGLPAIGRNIGANLSKTKYTLFIDADAEIFDMTLITKSIEMMESNNLDLLASKLNSEHLAVKILYKINNILTILSKYDKPFCTGMYMMVKTEVFKKIGGFDETVMHCEDYIFSKQIERHKFDIINIDVYSDNRRFKKIGYFGMIKYVFINIINRNNNSYFKKDINYWK